MTQVATPKTTPVQTAPEPATRSAYEPARKPDPAGAAAPQLTATDAEFYLTADAFFRANQPAALTYDDVSLATLYSEILPREADTATSLSDSLRLPIPILSSDMDTVTESRMAIAMALNGGLGLIHYNMPPKEQVKEVARVKRHIHGLIQDPITVSPTDTIGDVLAMIEERKFTFSTFPVVTGERQLIGLLPGNVVKERYRARTVAQVMTLRSALITEDEAAIAQDPIAAADKFFNTHLGINKMLVVNARDQLRGLVTSSDVEKITSEAKARRKPARDAQFRLVVGAAISPQRRPDGSLDRDAILEHIDALVFEHIDAVAISSAHAHTASLGQVVRLVRDAFPQLTIIAGNVTSGAGVEFLARAGASAVKVGQGPGSICTTRVVAGVGIPQLTALHLAAQSARKLGVRLIADGGITKSGDIVKALTLADAVILGGLLAGCREAPGEIMEIGGKLYKSYRGMGSLAAMKSGSAARYGHDKNDTTRKITAEGIEALKEVSGSVDDTLAHLIGGLQSGMGYLGAATLDQLRAKARYVRVSPAGQKEAAPHDVVEVSTRTN
ncbi:IMP dehydrogenase [Cephaloticoccus primus]|uniref:IMP dehydrogenase n=1 Tax=Cephaloticoccus primus TaxID=1548207 RepID=UPI0009EE8B64|nr:IMP dehydrogenase [Cephaloticoccus primus]